MNLKAFLHSFIALSATTILLHAQPQPVAFDWFEYSGQDAVEPKAGTGEYHNPILAGFYSDPSMCRAGEDYYLINSTFAYFPGIPIFHSRDLVNWEQIGNVIHRPGQLRYDRQGVSGGIFAPTIRHHHGTFYVICTMVGAEGNFIVTATNAAGPWSNPVKLGFEGIDPSIFFDEDGRAWIVNNGGPEGMPLYNGHRAIWIQEYDLAAQKMTGPRKVIVNGGVDLSKKPIWIEGPHLYKREGWYYLCCAEGGTGPQHSQVIFRGKNVDGPYTPWDQNPILTQRDLSPNSPGAVTCTGHADLVEGPDKNWWAVFLGVRPYQGRYSPMGRETFLLPVKWMDDGWPEILPKGERVPLTVKSPNNVTPQSSPAVPLSGNFTWRDDFKESALAPLWIMLRAPKETWWKLDSEKGQLAITPRADLLSGNGNPSYLARRVQHARFTASTCVEVPTDNSISAGLAVFQNERHYYFLAVSRDGDGLGVWLERAEGRNREVVKTIHVPHAAKMKLRAIANDAKCSFDYAADADNWTTLVADADATLLTTEAAGGFVGATSGMYARMDSGEKPFPSASTQKVEQTNSVTADQPDAVLRIKAGRSTPFTDSSGHVWLAEQGFDGGDIYAHDSDVAVAGTKEPGLFQCEHYAMSAFSAKVPNGKYLAKLYFAETYDGITGPGQRVFSFNVQGHEFKDFDVRVKAGGPNRAYVEAVPVEVTNAIFRIDFVSKVENPQINAIEIVPQG